LMVAVMRFVWFGLLIAGGSLRGRAWKRRPVTR